MAERTDSQQLCCKICPEISRQPLLKRITADAKAGETFDPDLECCAYHSVPGCSPMEIASQNFVYSTGVIDICERNDELLEFVIDLSALLQLRNALPEDGFRRAELENALYQAHLNCSHD